MQHVHRYQFTDRLHTRLPDTGWQRLSSANFDERRTAADRLGFSGRVPPAWAQDFLHLARVVYLVDTVANRGSGADGWTRHLVLQLQLVDPAPWQRCGPLVHDLLATMTSDVWEVTFTPGAQPEAESEAFVNDAPSIEVALFSGGLDSTAYAADRARQGVEPLMLVAHYTSDKKQQREIYDAVCAIGNGLSLRQFTVQPRGPSQPGPLRKGSAEPSTRSRGLLFLAAAVYAAAAHGATTVAIPENGQLAINPPLTVNRVAACSSRSVHPRTLQLVNRLIEDLGAGVRVENPLMNRTKAKVCELARDAGLGPDILARTVSCGHPPSRRRKSADHCGHCYPCLIRRAALWKTLDGDDRTPYVTKEPWNLPEKAKSSADLSAVRAWIDTPFTIRDLAADMPLPPLDSLPCILDVIERGRADMRDYLDSVATPNARPR